MPNEIELKLRIATADVPRLRRHAALRQHLVGKPVTRRLVSIYYDTLDLQLFDAAISLRVRRMSGGWFQAVKAAGHALAGLHQRMEWEDIIAGGEPDFTKITEPALAALFSSQQLRAALCPIFTTDVRRTEWQLAYEDGSAIEVALDLGELRSDAKNASHQTEPIQEVEIELKHGAASHVFDLALALQADIPLYIENISKAQRGYAFYREPSPACFKASAVTLKAKTTKSEAFQAMVGECLRQLQSAQQVVQDKSASESGRDAVHQMRVALRRLKAACQLFKADDELQQELRWLNGLLSVTRDWDVLHHETLPALLQQAALEPEGASLLQQHTDKARKRAYAALRRALSSQRYQRLLLMSGAWLLQSTAALGGKNALKYIRRRLRKWHARLAHYGPSLSGLTPQELHQLRIKAKRLRYAADFFTQPDATEKSAARQRRFIRRLTRLQQALGKLNDQAVAEKLLLKLAHGRIASKTRQTLAILTDRNSHVPTHAHEQANKAWQALLAAKPGGK